MLDISKLYQWYKQNKRELPWRKTTNPYKVWISEIILQQTRVSQGMHYYLSFISTYPTIRDLANSTEGEVLKLWQGLGYYSRARNLHATAKTVCKEYNGKFPTNYDEIKSLKGIGDYTAAAIASFCFNLPYAVVDGNVYRVLSRWFGIKTPIDSAKGKKEFAKLAQQILCQENPAIHNQAIMEFGALYCVPVNPKCDSCIFNSSCFAFNKKQVAQFPVKTKKIKQRNRYFNYLVIQTTDGVWLQKRTKKDVWQNLYEFPLIETNKPTNPKHLFNHADWSAFFGSENKININSSETYPPHILSHQKIHATFINISTKKITQKQNLELVKFDEIEKFAVPKLIEKYLSKF